MRAKFKLTFIERQYVLTEILHFSAVCKNQYDESGLDENNSYAKWTPSAELKMTITNPALLGKYEEGQEFYVDFTPVSKRDLLRETFTDPNIAGR